MLFRNGHFEIFKDSNGGWRFRLRARNGEIVAQSESYTRKDSAIEGAKACRRAAFWAAIEESYE